MNCTYSCHFVSGALGTISYPWKYSGYKAIRLRAESWGTMVPSATMWLDCGKKYDKEREKKWEQEGLDQKNSIFIPLGKYMTCFPLLSWLILSSFFCCSLINELSYIVLHFSSLQVRIVPMLVLLYFWI